VSEQRLRLVVVRHGQVEANLEQRYLGLRDDPLTPLGAAQAEAVAGALARLPLAAVYSSPLQRTVTTAAAIARRQRLEVVADDRLLEMSFGGWEGLTRAELVARSPEDARDLARWEEDPSVPPPGGDSLALVQARVLAFVAERAEQRPGQVVALVSHVGPIKALLCAALGLDLRSSRRLFLDPATVSVLDWGPQPLLLFLDPATVSVLDWGPQPLLRLFNEHAHLGWDAARWMRSPPAPPTGR
jgi:ribonuclease H / adenosylcobalamin/alpha-ribazole phosphatase